MTQFLICHLEFTAFYGHNPVVSGLARILDEDYTVTSIKFYDQYLPFSGRRANIKNPQLPESLQTKLAFNQYACSFLPLFDRFHNSDANQADFLDDFKSVVKAKYPETTDEKITDMFTHLLNHTSPVHTMMQELDAEIFKRLKRYRDEGRESSRSETGNAKMEALFALRAKLLDCIDKPATLVKAVLTRWKDENRAKAIPLCQDSCHL